MKNRPAVAEQHEFRATSSSTQLGNSPLIIIGMHRSGTSLVTRMLEAMGVFLGRLREQNDEALFFYELNNWLLRQAGGSWDRPAPVLEALADPVIRAHVTRLLAQVLESPRSARYFGWPAWLTGARFSNLTRQWGWKDPRNTYTLPLWLELFPEARVIHVVRHGVDVAASLRHRFLSKMNSSGGASDLFGRFFWLASSRKFLREGYAWSVRELEHGMELWDSYVTMSEMHSVALKGRALEIRFEDLTSKPLDTLSEVARFAGLTPAAGQLAEIAGAANPGRAYAFVGDPELEELAVKHGALLERHGYGPGGPT